MGRRDDLLISDYRLFNTGDSKRDEWWVNKRWDITPRIHLRVPVPIQPGEPWKHLEEAIEHCIERRFFTKAEVLKGLL